MKRSPTLRRIAPLIAAAVIALSLGLVGLTAAAQQPGATDGVNDEQEDDDDRESPWNSFDEVTVERIRPGDLADFDSGLPEGAPSRLNTSELPRSMRGEQMQEVTDHVAATTVEIIAVQRPPSPYRATNMIYRGHALWVSPSRSGEDPVLISTADWLRSADEIYAIDGDVSRALTQRGLQSGDQQSQPLSDFNADAGEVIERNRSELVALQVEKADPHVNMLQLVTDDDEREFEPPEKGLIIHDMEKMMPGTIFGFSPAVGSALVPIGYEATDDLEMEYSFYFLVTFQAILGAPVVGPDGTLLAISALRYPTDSEFSLAIPPGAIHGFLETGRATADDDDDD